MEDECGVSHKSMKVMVVEKRANLELEETSEICHKRVKIRDLESIFLSEGRNGKETVKALDLNSESRDDFECVSSVGPSEDKDSLKVWNEMKQNGFFSYSQRSVPIPKPCGRKKRNEGMDKKMELAKKERMDRFAKMAAPSGFLNGLNPGIINHVRNIKQVHSIIDALVRSEKHENGRHGNQNKISETKDLESTYGAGTNANNVFNQCFVPTSVFGLTNCPSNSYGDCEDDMLALKLSSASTIISDNNSSLSNDDSSNPTNVTSLSIKAANVASQWLELLNQDTKGRLAALRRSRKRVQDVIQTEFPCLISREFASNQQNDPCISNNAHHARWSALFDQMNKALSEEESQLESWQKKVKEMQVNALHNDCRLDKGPESNLAVRAAAASIYSTCNFLLSMENPTCC